MTTNYSRNSERTAVALSAKVAEQERAYAAEAKARATRQFVIRNASRVTGTAAEGAKLSWIVFKTLIKG